MEVIIGFTQSTRDLSFETDLSAEEIRRRVDEALTSGGVLRLEAKKNREFSFAAPAIAFVEIREAENRRVGFGF